MRETSGEEEWLVCMELMLPIPFFFRHASCEWRGLWNIICSFVPFFMTHFGLLVVFGWDLSPLFLSFLAHFAGCFILWSLPGFHHLVSSASLRHSSLLLRARIKMLWLSPKRSLYMWLLGSILEHLSCCYLITMRLKGS
jgi:hypothetical protein